MLSGSAFCLLLTIGTGFSSDIGCSFSDLNRFKSSDRHSKLMWSKNWGPIKWLSFFSEGFLLARLEVCPLWCFKSSKQHFRLTPGFLFLDCLFFLILSVLWFFVFCSLDILTTFRCGLSDVILQFGESVLLSCSRFFFAASFKLKSVLSILNSFLEPDSTSCFECCGGFLMDRVLINMSKKASFRWDPSGGNLMWWSSVSLGRQLASSTAFDEMASVFSCR